MLVGYINLIPKIIHHVWLGPKPVPDQEQKFIESWEKLHPDYDFIMWNDSNIDRLEINDTCRKAMENAGRMYACQADIVRYIAINKLGGVYIDTDVECYKNIDNLLTENLTFMALRPHAGNWVTNAFFASTPNHAILNSVINNITDEKYRVKNPYGPVYLTRHLRSYLNYKEGEIHEVVCEDAKVLHFDFWSVNNKEAYCRHYFRASWRK